MKNDYYVAISYIDPDIGLIMGNIFITVDYPINKRTINIFHEEVANTAHKMDDSIVKETVTVIGILDITSVQPNLNTTYYITIKFNNVNTSAIQIKKTISYPLTNNTFDAFLESVKDDVIEFNQKYLNVRDNICIENMIKLDQEPSLKRKIITLCGSSKFKNQFKEQYERLSSLGYIVLSLACFSHTDNINISCRQEEKLLKIHKHKIDISDQVFVINYGNYIGDGTVEEIEYAKSKGIEVIYMEPTNKVGIEIMKPVNNGGNVNDKLYKKLK
jgi:hypothetical protein